MKYLLVKWVHSFPDEPVTLYSELDEDRWETRKIEVFSDERVGYADSKRRTGSTKLSINPLPSFQELASDPQFKPAEITDAEFEKAWRDMILE